MLKEDRARDAADWIGLRHLPDWTKSRFFGGLVGVLLAVLMVFLLVAAILLIVAAVTGAPGASLGAGALIVALLGAPFLIWNTVIKHKALGFQKEGHLTDRLSKAVEQLGVEKTVKLAGADGISIETTQPNIEVRIGAILLLERIAQDSTAYDRGRDHVRVMEILCAYLRENAPASGAKISLREQHEIETADGDQVQGLTDLQFAEKHGITPTDLKEAIGVDRLKFWARSLAAPRADIALALRVIGRRNAAQRLVEAGWGKDAAADAIWVFDRPCPALPYRANGSPLPVADLVAYRQKLRDWQTHIDSYRGYRLDLRATNLQRADLSDQNLAGARLDAAQMQGATLGWAPMQGAILRRAQMQGASLHEAQMQGADLRWAQMQGANLSMARMQGADLRRAWLQGADLSQARMQGADLSDARMDAGTQLDGAELRGAGLQHLDWSRKPISQDQIGGTFGDGTVKLPPGLTRPPHWPKVELDWDDFTTEWRKWQSDPAADTPPAP